MPVISLISAAPPPLAINVSQVSCDDRGCDKQTSGDMVLVFEMEDSKDQPVGWSLTNTTAECRILVGMTWGNIHNLRIVSTIPLVKLKWEPTIKAYPQ